MSSLNKGKRNVGSTRVVSYGDQSPADDVVPLAWTAGDRRNYVGSAEETPNIIGWVCNTSGTPGLWTEITVPFGTVVLQSTFWFTQSDVNSGTPWNFVDVDTYGAAATDDWTTIPGEGSTIPNLIPMPVTNLLTAGHTNIFLTLWVSTAAFVGGNVAGAITWSVITEAGTVLGSGTTNAGSGGTGRFLVVNLSGLTLTNQAIGLKVHSSAAAGVGSVFQFAATLAVGSDHIF